MAPSHRTCWRQPIPTDLCQICKDDQFAATLLEKLILKSARNDTSIYVNDMLVNIKRGQCIFGRERWAKYFGLKKSEAGRVYRKLIKLEKPYNLVSNRKHKDCTVVTILDFEEHIYMNNQMDNLWTNHEQTTTHSETVKTVKTDERESKHSIKGLKEDKNLLNKIADDYEISLDSVLDVLTSLELYCDSHGKSYKDYSSALRSFIRKDIKDNKMPKGKPIGDRLIDLEREFMKEKKLEMLPLDHRKGVEWKKFIVKKGYYEYK